jgi:hypothetical protein
MKALVLTTGTPDTIKLVGSFEALGHHTDVVRYDVCPKNGPNHINIVAEVQSRTPDLVIYIGAIKSSFWSRRRPSPTRSGGSRLEARVARYWSIARTGSESA